MKTTHPFGIFRFIVVTTFLLQSVTAQTPSPDRTQPTQYAAFKPSVSAIIVVIVTLLFFLAFFSIYVRHCSNTVATPIAGARSRGNNTRGLDASLIETLPIFMYSEVKGLKIGKGALECAVCLNEFEDDESLRLLTKCDHVFHPECIDEWLSSHTTCPVCRANLAESDTVDETTTPVSDSVTSDGDDRGGVAIEVAEESAADDGGSDANRERIWSKFPRSHSTGHSLVRPVVNIDRFTLKLPDQIRNDMMTRALNRTTSSNRGHRATDGGEGSSGGKLYRRLGSLDRPERWMFTIAPPFLALESSMKKSNRSVSGSEGSKRFNLIGRLSFNRFSGSKMSEPELIVKGSNSNESSSSLSSV